MHRHLVAVAMAVVVALGAVAVAQDPASAATGCARRFAYIDRGLDWQEASAAAIQMGGHLATIDNPREERCVERLLSGVSFIARRDGRVRPTEYPTFYVWLGGSDARTEGVWRWLGNSRGGYVFYEVGTDGGRRFSNWFGNEPNNAGNEDCLAIFPLITFSSYQVRPHGRTATIESFAWNDSTCESEYPFVVEF